MRVIFQEIQLDAANPLFTDWLDSTIWTGFIPMGRN